MKNNQMTFGERFFSESGFLEDLLVAFGGSAFMAVLAQISVVSGGVLDCLDVWSETLCLGTVFILF